MEDDRVTATMTRRDDLATAAPPGAGPLAAALAASLIAHVLVGIVFRPLGRASGASEPPVEIAPTDRWSGTTAELPGHGGVVDVEVGSPSPPAAGAAPAPVGVPAPTQLAAPAVAPAPPRAVEPAPSTAATPIPPPPKPRRKRPTPAPTGSAVAAASPPASGDPGAAASAAGPPSGGEPGPGGSFGAAGESAVRDLGRAFTRAIPPSSDSDPVWATLPRGAAGELEIAIDVDEGGRVTGWRPLQEDPPRHLVSLVRRTMILLRQGTFALRGGSVTAGAQVLRLRAEVSDVDVPADHPGGSFGLEHRYAAGTGTAAFTQVSGRHVEVTVRLLRVEATPPG